MVHPTTEPTKERFVFIDALRGVAALAVVYRHMLWANIMEITLRRALPWWAASLSHWGKYGVQVFFVLSGFVIAHSLSNSRMDGRSTLNFILRRQLRLDPPYWCILVLTLLVQAVRLRVPSLATPPLPGVGVMALNMAYLQNILRLPEVVYVAWTLCIEIQFYLIFIVILAAAQTWSKNRQGTAVWAVAITGAASLAAIFFVSDWAWFVLYWYYFAAGALCCWALRDPLAARVFHVFAVLFVAVIVTSCFVPTAAPDRAPIADVPALLTGCCTALLIYGVGRAGRLTTLGRNRVLQYFGRISYSLYLVHVLVALTVLQAGYKLTGENEKMSLVWFAVAGIACVLAAHLLFISLERPFMRLASRLRRQSKPEVDLGAIPAATAMFVLPAEN